MGFFSEIVSETRRKRDHEAAEAKRKAETAKAKSDKKKPAPEKPKPKAPVLGNAERKHDSGGKEFHGSLGKAGTPAARFGDCRSLAADKK